MQSFQSFRSFGSHLARLNSATLQTLQLCNSANSDNSENSENSANSDNSATMKIIVWLILCLIWGTTWIFIKIGLADLPPITFATARFVLAVAQGNIGIKVWVNNGDFVTGEINDPTDNTGSNSQKRTGRRRRG